MPSDPLETPVASASASIDKAPADDARPPPRRRLFPLVLAAVFSAVVYWVATNLTVFSVQPIGALPDGGTVVMLRAGRDLRLFDSADAICLRKTGKVTLICRVSALGSAVEPDTIVLRLPYIRQFYLLSTGGQEFER